MSVDRPLTILDVLDNALDGDVSAAAAESLSARNVDDLYASVNDFYSRWEPPVRSPDSLRVHLGGWIAKTVQSGLARDLLNAALLYAHEVVIYDPVAAYFEPRRGSLKTLPSVVGLGVDLNAAAINVEATAGYVRHRENLSGHRDSLAAAFEQLAALAPLIREGVAVPIPHLRFTLQRQEEIFTAVRRMLADRAYLEAVSTVIDRPAIAQDDGPQIHFQVQPRTKKDQVLQQWGDPAYYLARTLALASASDAAYLPPSATEWRIYEQRLQALGKQLPAGVREDLTVAPAIVHAQLPFLGALPTKTLLDARRDEEGFEHWRSSLRRATRQIQATPADGEDFADAAHRILSDELLETAEEVRQATSKSALLSKYRMPTAITMATGAVGVATSAAALGAPLGGLVGVGTTGALKWVADTLLPPKLSGTKGVLANFVQPGRIIEKDDGDGWPIREALVLSPKHRP